MADPDPLARFVAAQAGSYESALREVAAGRKRSHWMWYIFPQIAGLGHSDLARRYAIASRDEARAYLAHPLLGARYRACLEALAGLAGDDPVAVFGSVDAMKLRSSLTLFEAAGGPPPVASALDRWFDGERDAATLAILRAQA
jgi:uncharacterized protein (DUF1810 family)